MSQVAKRDLRIDLLRIFSMLFIIMHHCIINDFGLQTMLKENTLTRFGNLLIIMNSIVIVGVNLFFLMSGYCKIHLKPQTVLLLIIKVYLISTLIQLTGLLSGHIPFDSDWIKNTLNPFDYYWFLGAYILLMFTSPLLNLIIDNISLSMFKYYVIGFFLIICIYGFTIDGSLHLSYGYSYLMAVALYILGNGIRKFQNEWTLLLYNRKFYILTWFTVILLNSLLIKLLYKSGNGLRAWTFYAYNNPCVAIASITLLLFAIRSNNNIKTNWFLRNLPQSTIITYLIHSTCWLTIFRQSFIMWQINHYGILFTLCMLPLFAFCIYLLATFINIIYEKILGNFFRRILRN